VAFALAPEGRNVLFATARKTLKYTNLLADPGVSLLLDTRTNSGRDYLAAESLTVEGDAKALRWGCVRDEMGRILVRKHPALEDFIADRETALILVEARQIVHVGHFQDVTVWKRT